MVLDHLALSRPSAGFSVSKNRGQAPPAGLHGGGRLRTPSDTPEKRGVGSSILPLPTSRTSCDLRFAGQDGSCAGWPGPVGSQVPRWLPADRPGRRRSCAVPQRPGHQLRRLPVELRRNVAVGVHRQLVAGVPEDLHHHSGRDLEQQEQAGGGMSGVVQPRIAHVGVGQQRLPVRVISLVPLGSLATGPLEWPGQRPLADEGYQLVVPTRRAGLGSSISPTCGKVNGCATRRVTS
jgi:hypothetical protein